MNRVPLLHRVPLILFCALAPFVVGGSLPVWRGQVGVVSDDNTLWNTLPHAVGKPLDYVLDYYDRDLVQLSVLALVATGAVRFVALAEWWDPESISDASTPPAPAPLPPTAPLSCSVTDQPKEKPQVASSASLAASRAKRI